MLTRWILYGKSKLCALFYWIMVRIVVLDEEDEEMEERTIYPDDPIYPRKRDLRRQLSQTLTPE